RPKVPFVPLTHATLGLTTHRPRKSASDWIVCGSHWAAAKESPSPRSATATEYGFIDVPRNGTTGRGPEALRVPDRRSVTNSGDHRNNRSGLPEHLRAGTLGRRTGPRLQPTRATALGSVLDLLNIVDSLRHQCHGLLKTDFDGHLGKPRGLTPTCPESAA